jgi:L-serine dehydratase
MKAANNFINSLYTTNQLNLVSSLKISLYGSLALTGDGHGTIMAIINGLCGNIPKTITKNDFLKCYFSVVANKKINLQNTKEINFDLNKDILLLKPKCLPQHPNGMRFEAFTNDTLISTADFFSIGGGFVVSATEINNAVVLPTSAKVPFPFNSGKQLFNLCAQNNLTIAELIFKNELSYKNKNQIHSEIFDIANVMYNSIQAGIAANDILPGSLKIRKRAKALYDKLQQTAAANSSEHYRSLAMTYAIAVNEENASFGKVVTAPTNGAAGTIPAVLEYYKLLNHGISDDKLIEFILTAAAIGMLYKLGASISAAEVGCQGEIGVASSMAAGALAAVLGGDLIQIEKAAEIAMEHSLGMTCDPVAGLVQIPCIERNALAVGRAIDACNLALLEHKPGIVSLDDIIKTMLQTGRDMAIHYKETSLGGLAVNIINC